MQPCRLVIHQLVEVLGERAREAGLRLLDCGRVRHDLWEALHDPEKGWGVRVPLPHIKNTKAA